MSDELVPQEVIENKIYIIRGQKIMLDRDLAALYGVPTHVLNQAVKRNILRFPQDFMFQLSNEEFENLISQIVISKRGGTRKPPYAFTEPGVAMLSSVLRSPRAVIVNIAIMRTFIKLRQLSTNKNELSKKLELLEKRVLKHDSDIRGLVRDIRRLSLPKSSSGKKIGFV